jgi:nucleotide-binding universal stress UspA family protein
MSTFSKIVVGINDRPEAEDAIALGRSLAEASGAKLILAAVFPYSPLPIGIEAYEEALDEDSSALFERAAARLSGLDVETRAVGGGSPAHGLNELAEAERPDAIVVGSTHRGALGRVFPGSVGERLLAGAPCPVAIAPHGYAGENDGLRVIAVGYDGRRESKLALGVARELASEHGAALRLLTVAEPPVMIRQYSDLLRLTASEYRERLNQGLEELPPETDAEGKLIEGLGTELRLADPADFLIAELERDVDLLVIGSRGYGPVRRVLLGGVSAKVIRSAPCPVLVVARGTGDEDAPGATVEREQALSGG